VASALRSVRGAAGDGVDVSVPPTFDQARNRREKARAAGLHPDYWYAVEHSRAVAPGAVVEVTIWGASIALWRDATGALHAMENRCAHRQLKLTLGDVEGCRLACAYHGWAYNAAGRLAHVPHELFGRPLPDVTLRTYPVKVRYGLIWLFPGDPALAQRRRIPDIPELERPNCWACVPLDFTWRAHHSMIVENVSDFTHAWLHRKYRPFEDARLTRCELIGDAVHVAYDTRVGRGRISGRFVDRHRVNANAIELCYDYPYQWSNTGGKIKHWCFFVPIDARTTRTFFLFYFESLKIPFTPFRIPRPLMSLVLTLSNRYLIGPLLAQDGFAVEAEQRGWEGHPDRPVPDLNPAVALFQQLTVRKWEDYLASAAGTRA